MQTIFFGRLALLQRLCLNERQMKKLVRKLAKRKRLALAVVSVLLLTAAAVAAGAYYLNKQNASKPVKPATRMAGSVMPTTADLSARLNQTTDPAAKAKIYSDITSAAMREGKKSEALDYAQKAYQLKQDVNTASLVAGTAELNGNWALAAEYYKKAADLSPRPADPKENADYNNYMILYNEMKARL